MGGAIGYASRQLSQENIKVSETQRQDAMRRTIYLIEDAIRENYRLEKKCSMVPFNDKQGRTLEEIVDVLEKASKMPEAQQ